MFLGWKERYCSLAVETIPSVGPARAEQGRILHSAALTISCTAGWPPKATFYDTPFEKQQQRRARLMETSLHCLQHKARLPLYHSYSPRELGITWLRHWDHLLPKPFHPNPTMVSTFCQSPSIPIPVLPLGALSDNALPSQSHHQEHLPPAPFHLSPWTSKQHHPILPARHCDSGQRSILP